MEPKISDIDDITETLSKQIQERKNRSARVGFLKCEVCGIHVSSRGSLFLNGKNFCSQKCLEHYANEVDNR